MKTLKTLVFAISIAGSAFVLQAAPPAKQSPLVASKTLRAASAFENVQPGEKLALVCNECNSVSTQTVASKDDAMKYCTEGRTVTCPSCKVVAKVAKHGPSGKQGTHVTTKIVNEKGEECMFVAQISGE